MTWAAALDRMTTVVRDTYPASVVYDPDGAAHSLVGIFDEAFELIEVSDDGAPISSTGPMCEIRLADLAVVPKTNDQLTVATALAAGGYDAPRRFKVWETQPDSSGNVVLLLTRVGA